MYIDMNGIQWPKVGSISTIGTAITTTGTIPIDPYTAGTYGTTTALLTPTGEMMEMLTERITRLERQLDMSNIAILAAMQKFNKQECENLKKMLDSNDPASVELAKTIIEESLCQ